MCTLINSTSDSLMFGLHRDDAALDEILQKVSMRSSRKVSRGETAWC